MTIREAVAIVEQLIRDSEQTEQQGYHPVPVDELDREAIRMLLQEIKQ